MARKFTETDVHPWKVAGHDGKTLRGKDGKPLTGFKGYKDAKAVADKLGAVAIRA
ncbi:hypothetical protein SEA_CREWMATE_35 [Arthrobacter phage Crewmate]|uniref:Uncharacterized protein n=1 Tax=Arthrobacter phage Crewmate TaxID=2832317 RepID=A0AA48Y3L8_9CAUD|nr:hypothetical protein PQE17_gp35 [Arthrobacter phage Crewmate]UIW13287.1 hypothetical protein SEA_CREWMATE_35 [Arthrobacter phage Crewmate]WGH21210.1 hypothetical protein SEA_OBITOO_34 [Arthrobacter phage ObiToo]